jgi:hypothetical protein
MVSERGAAVGVGTTGGVEVGSGLGSTRLKGRRQEEMTRTMNARMAEFRRNMKFIVPLFLYLLLGFEKYFVACGAKNNLLRFIAGT